MKGGRRATLEGTATQMAGIAGQAATHVLPGVGRGKRNTVQLSPIEDLVSPEDAAFYRDAFTAWKDHCASKGFGGDWSNEVIRCVHDHVEFTAHGGYRTGKHPCDWSEREFEAWGASIHTTRGLPPPTQRKYQTAIRVFQDWIVQQNDFQARSIREHGKRIERVAFRDNSVRHTVERELSSERRALTHEEITQLFDGLDRKIDQAVREGSKNRYLLMRDKAMLYTKYAFGLRADELVTMMVGSLLPNAKRPELGNCGIASVWGKGSKGSGKRHRNVHLTYHVAAEMLEWYLDHVRPKLAKNANPGQQGLWLTERGTRIRYSDFNDRFHKAVKAAGLENRGFVPHCLRHSYATHEQMRYDGVGLAQRNLGHKHASQTQTYTDLPEEYIEEQVRIGVRSGIEEARRQAALARTTREERDTHRPQHGGQR